MSTAKGRQLHKRAYGYLLRVWGQQQHYIKLYTSTDRNDVVLQPNDAVSGTGVATQSELSCIMLAYRRLPPIQDMYVSGEHAPSLKYTDVARMYIASSLIKSSKVSELDFATKHTPALVQIFSGLCSAMKSSVQVLECV